MLAVGLDGGDKLVGRVNDRTGGGKSMLMMLMIVSVLRVLQGMKGCCEEILGNSKSITKQNGNTNSGGIGGPVDLEGRNIPPFPFALSIATIVNFLFLL